MKLGYTILYVSDVERTVSFYEEAFGLSRRFVHESGSYAELVTGETTLAFAAHDLAEANFQTSYRRTDPGEPPPAFEIALVTEDVAAVFERSIEAGAEPLVEPEQKPWGQTVAYVRDVDGVVVELCTAVDR
jgi:Uncharacterized protein conserved in bacteria